MRPLDDLHCFASEWLISHEAARCLGTVLHLGQLIHMMLQDVFRFFCFCIRRSFTSQSEYHLLLGASGGCAMVHRLMKPTQGPRALLPQCGKISSMLGQRPFVSDLFNALHNGLATLSCRTSGSLMFHSDILLA